MILFPSPAFTCTRTLTRSCEILFQLVPDPGCSTLARDLNPNRALNFVDIDHLFLRASQTSQ